jgi:hypothetical protein
MPHASWASNIAYALAELAGVASMPFRDRGLARGSGGDS